MNLIRTRAPVDDSTRDASVPLRFVIASKGEKRDGLDLSMNRFDMNAFMRNPVMLWMHGREPARGALPIGRWQNLARTEDTITGESVFDQDDDFALNVERKYRDGYLNAVSVSWIPYSESNEWRYDLLEASAVSVPADPDALALGRDISEAIRAFEASAPPELERELTAARAEVLALKWKLAAATLKASL